MPGSARKIVVLRGSAGVYCGLPRAKMEIRDMDNVLLWTQARNRKNTSDEYPCPQIVVLGSCSSPSPEPALPSHS